MLLAATSAKAWLKSSTDMERDNLLEGRTSQIAGQGTLEVCGGH